MLAKTSLQDYNESTMRLKFQLLILCLGVWMAGCHAVPPPIAASGLTIKSFAVSPNPVERGAVLTFSWNAPGATGVSIWPMTYDPKTAKWYRLTGGDVYQSASLTEFASAVGQATVSVPSDARYSYRFDLEATGASGAKVTATSEIISLRCYPPLGSSGYCPFPAQSIQASYQPFEYGHLIWRGDTQEIFILSTNQAYHIPWSLQPAIPQTNPITPAPPGLYAPAERFAGLWSSFSKDASVVSKAATAGIGTPESHTLALCEILGWATAPEQTYTMNMQIDLDDTQSGVLFDNMVLSLPDQRLMHLILYDGANGTTGPMWSMISQ